MGANNLDKRKKRKRKRKNLFVRRKKHAKPVDPMVKYNQLLVYNEAIEIMHRVEAQEKQVNEPSILFESEVEENNGSKKI